jgi:excisionase family DNA binding protein
MLTVSQAAKAMNISESKLRKMIALGEVTPVRVGSKILFSEQYLQETYNLKTSPDVDINHIIDQVIARIAGIELKGGVKILFND